MTAWDIYWITRLDGIQVFSVLAVIALVMLLALFLIVGVVEEEHWLHYKKEVAITTSLLLIFLMFTLFIPSTKEMAAIYVIPKIVNNAQVQQLPDNLLNLVNTKLKEWTPKSVVNRKK